MPRFPGARSGFGDAGDVVLRHRLAATERDVRQVAPFARRFPDFDFGVQHRRVLRQNGLNEVALVIALAAVALERLDNLAVFIERFGASALTFERPAFAERDVPAAGALTVAGRLRALHRERRKSKNDRDFARVEVNEVNVRRFPGVVVTGARPAGENAFREGERVEQDVVAAVVEDVNAPVPHFAGAGVPVPVPIVLEFIAINREIRRRAEPKIFVDVFRELHRRRAFADRVARAVMIDASGENFAERFFFVQELFDFRLHFVAALLHPDLADALVFAGGGDGLAAFPNRVRKRFFDVNVFPGFHRPNGAEAVPMVASRDDDRVDIFIVEEGARVGKRFRFFETFFRRFDAARVRVAKSDDVDFRHRRESAEEFVGATAAADRPESNSFVGAANNLSRSRETRSDARRDAETDELTTI